MNLLKDTVAPPVETLSWVKMWQIPSMTILLRENVIGTPFKNHRVWHFFSCEVFFQVTYIDYQLFRQHKLGRSISLALLWMWIYFHDVLIFKEEHMHCGSINTARLTLIGDLLPAVKTQTQLPIYHFKTCLPPSLCQTACHNWLPYQELPSWCWEHDLRTMRSKCGKNKIIWLWTTTEAKLCYKLRWRSCSQCLSLRVQTSLLRTYRGGKEWKILSMLTPAEDYAGKKVCTFSARQLQCLHHCWGLSTVWISSVDLLEE